MTIPATRSGQGMINAYCLHLGIASPSSAERATALAELNDAYREFLQGCYTDERGNMLHHLFSFLHPTSVDLSVSAQGNAYYTHGNVTFTAVDAEATGEGVAVVVVAGSGALAAAEDTTTKIVTVTLASGGSTETAVVAACSALTLVTVTGSGPTNMAALAHTHLALHIVATACPSDFGGIIENIRYKRDGQDSAAGKPLTQISPEAMDLKIRDWAGDSDDPQFWCLRDKALSTTLGSLREFVFMPPTAAALTLAIRYRPDPVDLTDSAATYPVGNMGCERVIVQLAKARKERDGGQVVGNQNQEATRMMLKAVTEDAALFPTGNVQTTTADDDGFPND